MRLFSEFIVALSTVIGIYIYLVLSLLQIEHTVDNPSPLFSAIIVVVNLYAIAWIVIKEFFGKAKNKKYAELYFIVPLVIIVSFFIEKGININVEESAAAKALFIQWGAQCVSPLYVALYCFRHERLDILTKNMEVISLLGSVALILNIPNIVSSGVVQLAGGGGHQEIAYSGAMFIIVLLSNILLNQKEYRFKLFTTRFWRVVEIALIPILAIVILLSGGRGGAVLMIVAFLTCPFLLAKKKVGQNMLVFGSIILITVFVMTRNISTSYDSALDSGIDRSFNYINGDKIDTKMSDRDWIYVEARNIINESPVIGNGIWGGYAKMYKRIGGYSHNIFYDVLIHGGVLYFIIFILVLCRAFHSAYRMIKHDNSKAILLTYGLYITVMLFFSGTYLCCPQFWLFMVYSLLSQKCTMYIQGSK